MVMRAAEGHVFDPTILREYDIRGVVGKTLHEADARAIGRSFAVVLGEKGGKRVAVGRDGRDRSYTGWSWPDADALLRD
jgi:phosphomannomutase